MASPTTAASLAAKLAGRSIAICGGGAIGLATAVHLGRMGVGNEVVVIEKDASYEHCSAVLSAGGIRHQFSLKENILMSKYSAGFLREMAEKDAGNDEIAFRPNGYLFLAATEAQAGVLRANHETQNACGVDWVRTTTTDDETLEALYPWLHREDLAAASYSHETTGTREGCFDPWGFLNCLKREAVGEHGVALVEAGIEAVGCVRDGDGPLAVDSIRLRPGGPRSQNPTEVLELSGLAALVNATGAWSRAFLEEAVCRPNGALLTRSQQHELLGLVPIERRRRSVFCFHCPGTPGVADRPVPPPDTPLTVDPGGVWFRSEGAPGRFLCGMSPLEGEDDPEHGGTDADVLSYVDHDRFEDTLWPALAHRVPAFQEIKVTGAWSGFYDHNTLDQNAILGFHPSFSNLVLAGGFSGHGLQMAPAAGRAVAELLVSGAFTSLDLSAFGVERIAAGRPYPETGIV